MHKNEGTGTREAIAVVAALALLAACGGNGAETEEAEAPETAGAEQPGAESMKAACPMLVEDVEVAAAPLDEGAALVFTTDDRDQVEDLRARVRHMVAMHTDMREGGPGEGMHRGGGGEGMMHGGGSGEGMHGGGSGEGMHGRHGGMGFEMEAMHDAQATLTDIDEGIRVELRAEDSARTDDLRQEVEQYAQRLQAGQCPMMQRG